MTLRQGFLLAGIGLCAVLTSCAASTQPSPDAAPGIEIPAGPYIPGGEYTGRNGYITYVAGNTPVILSAPHGGDLLPAEIPDRTAASCGGSATTVTDRNTRELVQAMRERHHARYGNYPHVIVNNLSRRRLDPNRPLGEAACGVAPAEVAYAEWHRFVEIAKSSALLASGRAWYMDMHGHGHDVQRLEIGYLLTAAQLELPDSLLDATPALEDTVSIRTVSRASPLGFAALLRGSRSLGTLYADRAIPAVPSRQDPAPRGAPYFSGGDGTRRHACGVEAAAIGGLASGLVCGVQIESHFTGVRDNAESRNRFGDVTAEVLGIYLMEHWGLRLGPP